MGGSRFKSQWRKKFTNAFFFVTGTHYMFSIKGAVSKFGLKSLTCNYIQDKKLKEIFDDIPTLDELYALGSEGVRADIILVDAVRDKKLSMLKQLIVALVKGLNSNPAAVIKKIAGLVRGFN